MATFVVVIIDDSSVFEYTEELCPNIYALKQQSTVFKNFYTHPVCTLSRTGYMYGSYGKKIGSIDELILHTWPTNGYPSIASVLTANSYATCFVGKWHGGIDPVYPGTHADPFAQAPITRGFQEVRAMASGNLGPGGNYTSWTRLDSTAAGYTSVTSTGYATTVQIDEAIDWLTDHPVGTYPNRFLHVALNAPHAPFHVPDPSVLAGYTGETTTDRGKYLAALRAVDTELGRLLNVLNALVTPVYTFVWSDNGTPDSVPPPNFLYTDRLKRSSHKAGTNVLALFKQHDVLPSVSNRLMHSIDIGATILNIAGIAKPSQWDGLPFGRTHVLTEREDDDGKDRSCRTNCYLYRELTDEFAVVTEELYYSVDDPDEVNNVVTKTRHNSALGWLRARLAEAAI